MKKIKKKILCAVILLFIISFLGVGYLIKSNNKSNNKSNLLNSQKTYIDTSEEADKNIKSQVKSYFEKTIYTFFEYDLTDKNEIKNLKKLADNNLELSALNTFNEIYSSNKKSNASSVKITKLKINKISEATADDIWGNYLINKDTDVFYKIDSEIEFTRYYADKSVPTKESLDSNSNKSIQSIVRISCLSQNKNQITIRSFNKSNLKFFDEYEYVEKVIGTYYDLLG